MISAEVQLQRIERLLLQTGGVISTSTLMLDPSGLQGNCITPQVLKPLRIERK